MKIRTILGVLLIIALIAGSIGVVAAENGHGDQDRLKDGTGDGVPDRDRDCDKDKDGDCLPDGTGPWGKG